MADDLLKLKVDALETKIDLLLECLIKDWDGTGFPARLKLGQAVREVRELKEIPEIEEPFRKIEREG